MDAVIDKVRVALSGAQRVMVLIGESLAVESALPAASDEEATENSVVTMLPEEMATVDTFRRDPVRLWRWYLWRRARIAMAPKQSWPEQLAAALRGVAQTTVVTENVDGLADRVGYQALELHGNLWRTQCTGCGRIRPDRRTVLDEMPPSCDHCGSLVRPDIVLFGQSLDSAVMDRAFRDACTANLLLVLGAGGTVEPAATLARYTIENGGTVVEFDRERTAFSGIAHHVIEGDVDEMLSRVLSGR